MPIWPGDTPDAFIERVQDLRPREAKALLLSKRDLFELIQNEGSPGRRPIVLSDTPDALTGHTRGYGKDNLRPGDYLESFARFVREQRDEIAALNIICTRPADLSRASLKSLRLALGRRALPSGSSTPPFLTRAIRILPPTSSVLSAVTASTPNFWGTRSASAAPWPG